MKQEKFDSKYTELRRIVNKWDPYGTADNGIDDEEYCEEIKEFLAEVSTRQTFNDVSELLKSASLSTSSSVIFPSCQSKSNFSSIFGSIYSIKIISRFQNSLELLGLLRFHRFNRLLFSHHKKISLAIFSKISLGHKLKKLLFS